MTRGKILHIPWLVLSLASALAFAVRGRLESHHLERALQPGFDAFGRSCWLLVPAGMARTLLTVLPVCGFALASSITLAALSSSKSLRLGAVVRSGLDTLSALPGFLVALSLGVLLPETGLACFLGAFLMVVPSTSRLFEGQILKLQVEGFVLASEAMGASRAHVWHRHLAPFLAGSLRAILPFVFSRLILLEVSLSFLGLGAAPEHESWGRLLAQGKDYVLEAPWILASAALPLFLLLASFHLLSREEQN